MTTLYQAAYLFTLAILWWAYFGYLLFLSIISRRTSDGDGERTIFIDEKDELPGVTVIIPVHNEEKLMGRKLDNIADTDYPKDKLDVIVADGLSDDGTEQIVRQKAAALPFIRFEQTGERGKIPQINRALEKAKNDIVINTDVDGVLEKSTVRRIAAALSSGKTAVAGAYVLPSDCSENEADFWRIQNAIRFLESGIGLSSTVVAACYGFNKKVLGRFPEDVIADDVYLPFWANLNGHETLYLNSAKAHELRAAKNFRELLEHKERKGNADLREIFRFAKSVGRMRPLWLMVYTAKALHMVAAPFILIVFIALLVAQVASGNIFFAVATLLPAGLSAAMVNKFIVGSAEHDGRTSSVRKTVGNVQMFFVTNFILIAAVLKYPFFRQTSAYKKISRPG
ncbi:MAG: glycosyltransferase [Endomicrobiia bacterium]|nr:glycosyltransferase [Endomicrobiia bacterium]